MFYGTRVLTKSLMSERLRGAARGSSAGRGAQFAWVLLVALLGFALVGCGSPAQESPVTEAQAIEIAENALEAFNTGDYAAWSRDWSTAMRAAIDESAFLGFREQALTTLGQYVAISGVQGSPGKDAGTYRWTFDVEFEKASYQVWFGFKEGSMLVEGVQFEDPAT